MEERRPLRGWMTRAGGLGLLLLSCTVGCVGPNGLCLPWLNGDPPPRGEVLQVLALWGDGVVVQPDPMNGGVPTPGFAARVYLLGQNLGQPLAGDGNLIAYLYDGAQPLSEKAVPTEIWKIDPVNLQRLFAHDALGWGYNLWLPWRTYRPDVSQVRLVIKYQSPQGRPAWSSSTDFAVRRPTALPQPAAGAHAGLQAKAPAGRPEQTASANSGSGSGGTFATAQGRTAQP
jgi:hypothetical protein